MGWKEVIKKDMANAGVRKKYTYTAAKTLCIMSSFVFFLNLFFLVGGLYTNIGTTTLLYTFFWCILSICIYIYAATQKYLGDIWSYSITPILVLIIIFSFLSINGGVQLILDLL